MGVTDQFGLFDIAAHVIPGVVVLSALGWVVVDVQGGLPALPGDFLVATVGLVAAYVVGQLCQLLADTDTMRRMIKGRERSEESIESELLRKWAEAREKDAFAAGVLRALGELFGGEVPREDAKKDVKAREQRFRAAYAYVIQKGRPERPQMFKAIASFHESMVPASAAVLLAGVIVLLRSGGVVFSLPTLVVVASLGAMLLFRRAYAAFDKRFAESVYYAFYALTTEGEKERSRTVHLQKSAPDPDAPKAQ